MRVVTLTLRYSCGFPAVEENFPSFLPRTNHSDWEISLIDIVILSLVSSFRQRVIVLSVSYFKMLIMEPEILYC